MMYSDPAYSSAGNATIDITPEGKPRTTISAAKHPELWAKVIAGDYGSVLPFEVPLLSGPALASALRFMANDRIERGYCGARVSLYGYFAQLNHAAANRALDAEETADLATLVAAAEWEQAVLDAASAAVANTTQPAEVVFPDAPAALAALAAAS